MPPHTHIPGSEKQEQALSEYLSHYRVQLRSSHARILAASPPTSQERLFLAPNPDAQLTSQMADYIRHLPYKDATSLTWVMQRFNVYGVMFEPIMALIEQRPNPWFTREYFVEVLKNLTIFLQANETRLLDLHAINKRHYVLEQFLRQQYENLRTFATNLAQQRQQANQKIFNQKIMQRRAAQTKWQARKCRYTYMKKALRVLIYAAAAKYLYLNKEIILSLAKTAAPAFQLIQSFFYQRIYSATQRMRMTNLKNLGLKPTMSAKILPPKLSSLSLSAKALAPIIAKQTKSMTQALAAIEQASLSPFIPRFTPSFHLRGG